MICNIIDNRTSAYRWKSVIAIIEATSHDNNVVGSDYIGWSDGDEPYGMRRGIPVSDAVQWANAFEGNVTLFLYDDDTCFDVTHERKKDPHFLYVTKTRFGKRGGETT